MNTLYIITGIGIFYGVVKYNDVIISNIYSLFMNTIYWYSYIEIKTNSLIKQYCESSNKKVNDTKTICYLKDNHLISIPQYKNETTIDLHETPDVVVCLSNGLAGIIDLDNELDKWIHNKAKSNTEFINVSVQFKDDSEQHTISFNTEHMNLYVVDNKINKYIIWYLVNQQHNLNYYGVSYSIQLMDHNVNISSHNEDANIIIQESGYYVK